MIPIRLYDFMPCVFLDTCCARAVICQELSLLRMGVHPCMQYGKKKEVSYHTDKVKVNTSQ